MFVCSQRCPRNIKTILGIIDVVAPGSEVWPRGLFVRKSVGIVNFPFPPPKALPSYRAIVQAPAWLTYMGAYEDSPRMPKAVDLITTLPASVKHLMVKKKPKCHQKDQGDYHFVESGWVQGGKASGPQNSQALHHNTELSL